jgi:hypothetical protein
VTEALKAILHALVDAAAWHPNPDRARELHDAIDALQLEREHLAARKPAGKEK